VLDLKPYQSSYRVEDYKIPEWHTKLLEKVRRI